MSGLCLTVLRINSLFLHILGFNDVIIILELTCGIIFRRGWTEYRLFAMTLTLIVINMYMSGQDET